jgi:hypothetical protein
MTKDTFDNMSDVKAAIAGLDFIISNAAKYDIDDNTLGLEIQQLGVCVWWGVMWGSIWGTSPEFVLPHICFRFPGLPKENSDALLRSYRDSKTELRQGLAKKSFQVSQQRLCNNAAPCLILCHCCQLQRLESLEWRVDSLLSSNTVEELNVPAVQLKLNLTPLQNTVRKL